MLSYESLLETAGGFGRYQILMLCWFHSAVIVIVCNVTMMVFAGIFPICPFPNSTENCTEPHFHSVVTEWNLLGPRTYISMLMTSLQMAGLLVGATIAGQLSDRFGRKRTSNALFMLLCVAGFLSGFSTSWQMFTAFRIVIGVALGAVISVQFVFTTEQIVQRWRMLVFVGGWALGFMLEALFAALTRDWRWMAFVSNAFGMLPISLSFFLVESPKWLLARNRIGQAIEAFRQIAAWNKVDLDNVLGEESLVVPESPEPTATTTYTYWHLFRNWTAAVHCIILVIGWGSVSIIWYGLFLNAGNLAGDPALNTFCFGLLQLFIQIIVPLCDHKFSCLGRKMLLEIGWTCSVLAQLATLLALQLEWNPTLVTIFAITGLLSTTTAWVALEIYTIELFPTVLRNMGNAICNASARIGGIIAPQAPLLAILWAPAPVLLFCIISVINLVLNFIFLPETKGKPLPDMENKTATDV